MSSADAWRSAANAEDAHEDAPTGESQRPEGETMPVRYYCLSETWGDGSEPFVSVQEFLDHCQECFGESPELMTMNFGRYGDQDGTILLSRNEADWAEDKRDGDEGTQGYRCWVFGDSSTHKCRTAAVNAANAAEVWAGGWVQVVDVATGELVYGRPQ